MMRGGMDHPHPAEPDSVDADSREHRNFYLVLFAIVVVIAAISAITPLRG
jgi:hypothetical protein